MAGLDDLQAGRGEQRLELAAAIAALVMVRLVVGVPHPGIGRGGGAEPAAGLHHPRQGRDGLGVLGHVLEHVEGADQVEAVLGQVEAVRQGPRLHPRHARGRDVPGYASLMVAVLLSLGLQMLALGIIGEYLGRIFQEVKRRPLYVTRKAYGLDEA